MSQEFKLHKKMCTFHFFASGHILLTGQCVILKGLQLLNASVFFDKIFSTSLEEMILQPVRNTDKSIRGFQNGGELKKSCFFAKIGLL